MPGLTFCAAKQQLARINLTIQIEEKVTSDGERLTVWKVARNLKTVLERKILTHYFLTIQLNSEDHSQTFGISAFLLLLVTLMQKV